MKLIYLPLISHLILLIAAASSHGESYRVSSAEDLAKISDNIRAGDTVVLSDGTYTDEHFIFKGEGSKAKPIILRAETAGKVIMNGSSRLSLSGEYLFVDGLYFIGGALDSGSVIDFSHAATGKAEHSILRNTAIVDYNPPDMETRYFWVMLQGYGNTVENCLFSGQAHSGVTVCVRLEGGEPAGHIIRRNHFKDRPAGTGNGFETIRIGTGQHRMTNARCVVTENLFERCDGEIEIVSNKSCENAYIGNTFLNCAGALTIRQGNRCRIVDNVFMAEDTKGASGLRITGANHHIKGNYFSGLEGRAGGVVSLRSGTPNAPRGGYPQVQNCTFDSNTFFNNPGSIYALDAGYEPNGDNLLPEQVIISKSLILKPDDASSVLSAKQPSEGIDWVDNVVVGNDAEHDLPAGIERELEVPAEWKKRLSPVYLNGSDVGPTWSQGL